MLAFGTLRSCVPEDDLLAFAAGQVAPSTRREIVEHLRSCAECREVVAELVRDDSSEGSTRDALVVPSDRPSKRSESRSFEEGQLVQERYEVIRFVARGGMGEVYEVFDRSLCEHSALKTLRGDYCDDAEAVERLKREVRLMRKVSHPSICRIGDFGVHRGDDQDIPFYTMEYVDGETLSERIKSRGAMALDECLRLCATVAAAIDVIHAAGIIHRDIKAGNVMLEKGGRVILTDFGLATVNRSEMTLTGAGFLGSPLYVAPEQARGTKTTAATDVYAFGILVYYTLSGTFPFVADTPLATVTMRLSEPPRPLTEVVPETPAALWNVLRTCLALEPSQRFVSCGEVVRALERAVVPLPLEAGGPSFDGRSVDTREARGPEDSVLETEEASMVDGAAIAPVPTADAGLEARGLARLPPWSGKVVSVIAFAFAIAIVGMVVFAVSRQRRAAAAISAATPARMAFVSFRARAGVDSATAEATYDAFEHLDYVRMATALEGYASKRPLLAVEWADLAVAWMAVGDEGKAARASTQAVDLDPPSGDVREYVAAVFDDVRGRHVSAKTRYARLWEKYPADTYLGYLVARDEFHGGAPHDAEATLLELTRRGAAGPVTAELEGFIVSTTRDPARIERTANRLIEVAKTNKSLRLEARAWRLLGTVAEPRGDATLAMTRYRESEKLYLERGEPVSASDVTDDIAQLHRTHGRAAEAVPLHLSVLAIKRAAGQPRGVSSALINLGAAYYFLGRFDKSAQAWTEGLAVADSREYMHNQIPLLINLAATRLLVEDLVGASSLYSRAMDKASVASDHPGEVYVLEGRAEVAFVRGRFDEAEELLTHAKRLVEAFRIVSREASLAERWAILAYARGERPKVESYCGAPLARIRSTHDQNRLEQSLPLCAVATAIGGNVDEALRLVDEARATVATLEGSNPRREAISRAEAFVAYLAGDLPRCLRVAHEGSIGTDSIGMNGPSTELRVLASLARAAAGDSTGANEELEAAKGRAARSVDPRSGFRVRAVAAMLSGDAKRLENELQKTSNAGFTGVADELRALARMHSARRRKP
jgi:tRNA A-37 threonylcarbamoyl transferase component Bud32/tetratricopeptide (TPR) repeat protein